MSGKCIDMSLVQKDINIGNNLGDKISNYDYGSLGVASGNTLIRLKAMDTVKDGADPGLAMEIFQGYGDPFIQENCKSLPSKIKTHFDTKVSSNQLKHLEYTRIKSRGDSDVIMEGFNCDCIIPDCGPLYGPGNNKTPVIKKVNGTDPPVKYSLGNMMDSGPSSNNSISNEFKGTYDIPRDIMNLLGYPNCSISVENSSPSIYIDSEIVARNLREFKDDAAGNKSKGEKLKNGSTSTPRKKKLLYFKSLGDGLIVFFWYVYCLKYEQTCALLTCDSVVALQADIFSQRQNNAYFAWNFTEKGEKHISHVYAKCAPPNWVSLCRSECDKLVREYRTLIAHIDTIQRNNDIIVDIGDGRNIIDAAIVLFQELKYAVTTLQTEFNSLYTSYPKDEYLFNKLKSYALNSPIKKIDGNRFFLKYPHTKLCSAGSPCYIVNRKNCNLQAKIRDIQLKQNNLDALLKEKIEGGRNPFDKREADEAFLLHKEIGSYDKAIKFLKEFILNVLEDLIDSETTRYISHYSMTREPEFVFQGKESAAEKEKYVHDTLNNNIADDDSFLYEYLTYEFHAIPDYSSRHIRKLCTEVIDITIESYNIISELKSQAQIERSNDPSYQSQETSSVYSFFQNISPYKKEREKVKTDGGRKTRRIRKKFTLKHKKRSMRKTQRRRNIIK